MLTDLYLCDEQEEIDPPPLHVGYIDSNSWRDIILKYTWLFVVRHEQTKYIILMSAVVPSVELFPGLLLGVITTVLRSMIKHADTLGKHILLLISTVLFLFEPSLCIFALG